MLDPSAPTLNISPTRPHAVVVKLFTELAHGDLIVTPQGVVEQIIGEPRQTERGWAVGLSCTASIGPLESNFGNAHIAVLVPLENLS